MSSWLFNGYWLLDIRSVVTFLEIESYVIYQFSIAAVYGTLEFVFSYRNLVFFKRFYNVKMQYILSLDFMA